MSPVQARITKFGPEMDLSTVKIHVDFGLDKHSAAISFLNVKAIFLAYLQWCLCLQSRRHLGTRMCVSVWLQSRGLAHPICDPSPIIATRQLDALTVPWTHNVSNNYNNIQSHLLHWYKCNSNRFNHHERQIFLNISHQRQSAIPSCRDQVIAQWLKHSTCSRMCHMKILITIYFYIWTWYKPIIAIIKARQGISIKY